MQIVIMKIGFLLALAFMSSTLAFGQDCCQNFVLIHCNNGHEIHFACKNCYCPDALVDLLCKNGSNRFWEYRCSHSCEPNKMLEEKRQVVHLSSFSTTSDSNVSTESTTYLVTSSQNSTTTTQSNSSLSPILNPSNPESPSNLIWVIVGNSITMFCVFLLILFVFSLLMLKVLRKFFKIPVKVSKDLENCTETEKNIYEDPIYFSDVLKVTEL